MQTWTLVRFLHLAGVAFFVGGQLLLVAAVAPTLRRSSDEQAMPQIARRFGAASAVALALVIATGAAMASHFQLWRSHVLQLKLVLLVVIFVLTGLHVASSKSRAIPYLIAAGSLVVLWLGVKLTYG